MRSSKHRRRSRLAALLGAVTGTSVTLAGLAVVPQAHAAPVSPVLPERPVSPGEHGQPRLAGKHAAARPAAPRTVTVQSGDTLWSLARRYLGSGPRWPGLYSANRAVVGADPDLIIPGERLAITTARGSFGGSAPVAVPARQPVMSGDEDGPAASPVSHAAPVSSTVSVSGTVTSGSLSQLASVLSSMGYDGAGLAAVAGYLRGHGYTAAGAAGVDACIAGESAGNPESVGSGGFGLIGWTGNSIGLPAGYSGPTGNRAFDLAAQEAGVVGYNSAVGNVSALNAASGPSAAAWIYSADFEKPRVPGSDIRSAVGLAVFAALGG